MNTELLQAFQRFYENYDTSDLSCLDEIYDSNIVFRDPLHEIRGIGRLTTYFHQNTANLNSCHFDFLESSWSDSEGFIVWKMIYSHNRLSGGKPLELRGMTHIRWAGDRIIYHEDFYDVGAMVYEHVPVIGNSVKWLKNRLVA